MIVECPGCATIFPVDPKKVPTAGIHARCTVCSEVFFVGPPEEAQAAPLAEAEAGAAGTEAAPEPGTVETEPVDTPVVDEDPAEADWEVEAATQEETGFAEVGFDQAEPTDEAAFGEEEATGTEEGVPEPGFGEDEPSQPGFSDQTGFGGQEVAETEFVSEPGFVEEEFGEDETFAEPGFMEEETGEGEVIAEPGFRGEETGDEEGISEPGFHEHEEEFIEAEVVEREEPSETATVEADFPQEEEAVSPAQEAPAFGKRDPKEKAQRLARVLVSDIILYNPDRHQAAMETGNLQEEFEEEIQKSWAEYVEQVGDEIAETTPFFTEALNEILAKGEEVF